jgi:hypothetical protein
MAKITGWPQPDYRTSWGETIHGLVKPDKLGRWRIADTATMFREPAERLAVKRFLEQHPADKINVPLLVTDNTDAVFAHTQQPRTVAVTFSRDGSNITLAEPGDPAVFWQFVRQQIIDNPEHVASLTGIAELAGLKNFPLPRAP